MVEVNDEGALATAMGQEIAYWRRRREMSRDELAALLGRSRNTVGRYERGETMPDVSETWAIADALGVTLSHLISRVEDALRADIAANDTPGASIHEFPAGSGNAAEASAAADTTRTQEAADALHATREDIEREQHELTEEP
jgi:transcriptional regulator with XRE-family HTH domain